MLEYSKFEREHFLKIYIITMTLPSLKIFERLSSFGNRKFAHCAAISKYDLGGSRLFAKTGEDLGYTMVIRSKRVLISY